MKDFEKWNVSFEENASFRAENGEIGYQVFQSVDDPNEITVVFQWDENEDPRAFFQSEDMRERMANAGLVGAPDLNLVELVEQKVPKQTSA